MTRKPMFWLLASGIVMLLLPWLAVTFARSDAGMAVILLLFFAIDPGFCITAGYYAGADRPPLVGACGFLRWLSGGNLVVFLNRGNLRF